MKYLKRSLVSMERFLVLSIFSLLIPSVIFAATGADSGYLNNPLGGTDTIPALLTAIINIMITVAIPIITLAIIYSGFLYVSARGDKSKLEAARKMIMGTLIGASIIFGSYVIAGLIENTLKQVAPGPSSYLSDKTIVV